MNPFEYLSNKLGEKLLDMTSRAQRARIEERDGKAAAAADPTLIAPPNVLTPQEMAAFAQRRRQAWRFLIVPSIVLMLLAIAVFYFNPPVIIPYALFALGFGMWLAANLRVVCPRCQASLLGKAEQAPRCRRCGVKLR